MKTYKTKSGKTYTKKQIREAIKYWTGYLKPINESALLETEGDNEASVAEFIFQTLKDSYRSNAKGILIRSIKNDDAIDFSGNKVSINSIINDMGKTGINGYARQTKLEPIVKSGLDYSDTDDSQPPVYTGTIEGYTFKVITLINELRYDFAVIQLGSLGLPGDIAVVKSDPDSVVSVVEVKNNSLGKRIFNPTFAMKNGVLVPVGRYSTMWSDRVMTDINKAIKDNGGNPNITGIPLNCEFDDFVKNYSTKNPFGRIEYVAIGYGDTGITFYKTIENPRMDIYGTGMANRRAERRANSLHDEFNAAYLSLRTRTDKPGVYGQVDFCFNGGIMTADRDVKIRFN